MPDEADLELALLSDPNDDEAWAVYADWLQAQGDPRGELAAVQLAIARKGVKEAKEETAREAELLAEHAAAFMPSKLAEQIEAYDSKRPNESESVYWKRMWQADEVSVGWHAGFIRSARLARGDPEDYPVPIAGLVANVLTHPSARFLQDLTIGPYGEYGEYEYDDVAQALAAADLRCLRRLSMAEFETEHSMLSWAELGDLSGIWTAAPNLEHVRLRGGSCALGEIKLPRVQSFALETTGLSAASIESIATAAWPRLRHLEMWFGVKIFGCEGSTELLAPILAGNGLPSLRSLGLMNAEFSDEIAGAVANSQIAKQIERLDLSMGLLSEKGVDALVRGAGNFANLNELIIEDNYVPEEACRALEAAFPFAQTGEQKELYQSGTRTYRFVTMSE